MKKRFSLVVIFVFSMFLMPNLVQGAEPVHDEQFRLEKNTTRYYVTSLEEGEVWFVNLTAQYDGVYNIFIYAERPTQSVLIEGTAELNENVVANAAVKNMTPSETFSAGPNRTVCTISLEYNATKTGLHYLEIVLLESGPDTYILTSSHEIETYFIPFISGFPIANTYGIMITSIIALLILKRNQVKR